MNPAFRHAMAASAVKMPIIVGTTHTPGEIVGLAVLVEVGAGDPLVLGVAVGVGVGTGVEVGVGAGVGVGGGGVGTAARIPDRTANVSVDPAVMTPLKNELMIGVSGWKSHASTTDTVLPTLFAGSENTGPGIGRRSQSIDVVSR